MPEFYKLIADEKKLKSFIEWLPDCKETEIYQIFLFSRKKYLCEHTKSNLIADKNQFKRITSRKQDIFQKIKQLEVQIGCYQYKGVDIPQEALAIYITLNPRCLLKASINTTKVLLDLVTKSYSNYNPQAIAMSEIQKANGTTYFKEFDFDDISYEDLKDKLEGKINFDSLHFVKTRGGIHLLVELSKVDKKNKTWYQSITAIKGCDISGDMLHPIHGCFQGNFVPYFITD